MLQPAIHYPASDDSSPSLWDLPVIYERETRQKPKLITWDIQGAVENPLTTSEQWL